MKKTSDGKKPAMGKKRLKISRHFKIKWQLDHGLRQEARKFGRTQTAIIERALAIHLRHIA